MKKRKYKKNDLLSIIGLGGISIKGLGLKNSSNLISYAYDNGVNYFDVAPRIW
jgi:Predicted oxidoreductases (related to aryl-alcohol dehydrogenases)